MASPLELALTTLYGAPPERFLETRKTLAAELKASGNAAGAKEVLAQRKPTQVAHWLNRLSREFADEVEALAKIGHQLGKAHQPDALRALIAEQRQAVQSLTEKVARAFELGSQDAASINTVLYGATTSAERAAELKLGRMSKAPEAASSFFGGSGEMVMPAVSPAPSRVEPVVVKVDHHAEAAEAEARKKREHAKNEARAAAQKAENEAQRAEKAVEALEKAHEHLNRLAKEAAAKAETALDTLVKARAEAKKARGEAEALRRE